MQRTSRMLRTIVAATLLLTLTTPVFADSSPGRCTITPKGETTEPAKRACRFAQRQGYVNIGFEDEDDLFLSLTPLEGVGNYRDSDGNPAYRKKGLGDKGVVFDTALGLVRVYWAD